MGTFACDVGIVLTPRRHRRRRGLTAAAPRQLVLVDELPLRGPGKPDRAAIRELATAELTARLFAEASRRADGDRMTPPVTW